MAKEPIPENAIKIKSRIGTIFLWQETGKGTAKCRSCELVIPKGQPRLCVRFYYAWSPEWEKSKKPSRYRSENWYVHVGCFGSPDSPDWRPRCYECGLRRHDPSEGDEKPIRFRYLRGSGKQYLAILCEPCIQTLPQYCICGGCGMAILTTYATLALGTKTRHFKTFVPNEPVCMHCAKVYSRLEADAPITLWEQEKMERELKRVRKELTEELGE